MRYERQECDTNKTSGTRVRNFDFYNDSSENIFSHPYISYIANESLQGEEQFHSNAWFPWQNAFEKCTTKIELYRGKSYIKRLNTRL